MRDRKLKKCFCGITKVSSKREPGEIVADAEKVNRIPPCKLEIQENRTANETKISIK